MIESLGALLYGEHSHFGRQPTENQRKRKKDNTTWILPENKKAMEGTVAPILPENKKAMEGTVAPIVIGPNVW